MKHSLSDLTINANLKISETMKMLNDNEKGIVFVVSSDNKLLGTVTDGDIRRALLRGSVMEDSIKGVMKNDPIVAPESMTKEQVIDLMRVNQIYQLPIINQKRQLVGVEFDWDNKTQTESRTAFIMAGGEGQRLRPLTEKMPKPMLKVSGKPLLEILILCLKNNGFSNIVLNVRYLGHIIKDYFKDGSDFGVLISYVEEPEPMGTAGSLGLLKKSQRPKSPFLVVNADVLTTLNFEAFYNFHNAAHYDFTLCGRPYKVQIPFGYPLIDGDVVKDFQEKPEFTHLVNSGIYCLSPKLFDYVPRKKYFDMPSLIRVAIEKSYRVGVFPLREKFHEIGRVESYKKAEEFFKNEMKPILNRNGI